MENLGNLPMLVVSIGLIYSVALLINIRRKQNDKDFNFDNVVSFGLNEKFKALKAKKVETEKEIKNEVLASLTIEQDDEDFM